MIKKVKNNIEVAKASELVNILQNNLSAILSQPLWKHKISIKEKAEYLEIIATARINLFRAVVAQFPELKGKIYSVSNTHIEYNEEEIN